MGDECEPRRIAVTEGCSTGLVAPRPSYGDVSVKPFIGIGEILSESRLGMQCWHIQVRALSSLPYSQVAPETCAEASRRILRVATASSGKYLPEWPIRLSQHVV